MSRKSLYEMTTNKMTSAKKSSNFWDMGISEMNSTHHFGYKTSSKQCRIIKFFGCDLIVKSLESGGPRRRKSFTFQVTQQLVYLAFWKNVYIRLISCEDNSVVEHCSKSLRSYTRDKKWQDRSTSTQTGPATHQEN